MNRLVSYLEKEGFEVFRCGGLCPFEIDALHYTGLSVYLKCRQNRATLYIYKDEDQEIEIHNTMFQSWQKPDAGYLEEDEAFYVFYSLWSDARDFVFE